MNTEKSVSSVDVAQTPQPALPVPGQVRLAYLDGLRGWAAIYVLAYHIYLDVGRHATMPWYLHWLGAGHFAVDVFIVLSGYSLMLPIARSADGQLRGGAVDYLKRRAKRILPPYYAALLLTLLMGLVIPAFRMHSDTLWDGAIPMFTPWVLVSRFLMVYNLNPAWAGKISSQFWSVATEWQIYLVFPLILLPVWRRFGNVAVVFVGMTIGWLLGSRFPYLFKAYPIYIGLFACGMVAAALNFSHSSQIKALCTRVPWGIIALICSVATVYLARTHGFTIWPDVFVGFVVACLLVYCTRAITDLAENPRPFLVRLLEEKWSIKSGHFSYSIYLVHYQTCALVHLALIGLGCTFRMQTLLLPLGFPLSLLGGYAFHVAFEKPFIVSPKAAPTLR